MADVYTEEPGVSSREGAAFSALVDALRRPHIHAVVIPSTPHFSRFGGPLVVTPGVRTDPERPGSLCGRGCGR